MPCFNESAPNFFYKSRPKYWRNGKDESCVPYWSSQLTNMLFSQVPSSVRFRALLAWPYCNHLMVVASAHVTLFCLHIAADPWICQKHIVNYWYSVYKSGPGRLSVKRSVLSWYVICLLVCQIQKNAGRLCANCWVPRALINESMVYGQLFICRTS